MRFCLITTFFGAHSFGGDAVFVERLAGALARHGHDVDVVHCVDAFESVRGDAPLRAYNPPDGVRVHALHSKTSVLSPAWTHQTGRLGPKARPLRRLLSERNFDVVHIHNISLIGADVIDLGRRSAGVTLMTAHEHWLACPLSVLWKFDRRPCDGPQCARCTLHARRPPQLWRKTDFLARSLEQLDALICPSDFTLQTHRRLGVRAPFVKLPYFIPDDWATSGASDATASQSGRPYVVAAGRLVKSKGLQRLIPLMAQLPQLDLRIAGVGPFERELRRLAGGLSNVHFLGLLDGARVRALLAEARAVVVPSLVWETFGYGVLEAFSVGTPAIVSTAGALPEVASTGGGGIVCRSDADYLLALRNLTSDDELRSRLGSLGRAAAETIWSEETHLEGYLGLIAEPQTRSARPRRRVAVTGAGD